MSITVSPDSVEQPVAPPEPSWIGQLHSYIHPEWTGILSGRWACGVREGRLSLAQMQAWMLQLYPFIHLFPKFLAEALIKCEDERSRNFFIDNIRVERAHARHWIWMGEGFGVPPAHMLALANDSLLVHRDVQSLTDWMWAINTRGSLAEAVAATSFAIEGIAGDIARSIPRGFARYEGQPGVDLSRRTYRWMQQHARYDEEHPQIALEIVERYATTTQQRRRVILAANRSLELLHNALLQAIDTGVPH